jgi:hypothetical protein
MKLAEDGDDWGTLLLAALHFRMIFLTDSQMPDWRRMNYGNCGCKVSKKASNCESCGG